MKKLKKSKDIGKEIWFFEYLDHAFHIGTSKEALNEPYKLWCVGIVEKETEDLLLLRNSGSTSHKRESDSYELIIKCAIVKRTYLGEIE